MVRLKQLDPDGASFGEVVTWDAATGQWAPKRARLISTGSPSLGGGPGAFTYTFSGDEAIKFADTIAPGSLTLTFPGLLSLTPGQRVALYLPNGNPLSSIVWVIPAGPPSNMTDPTSATEATTAPGTGVTIPAGTYTGPTWLEFEIVNVGAGEWRLHSDRTGSGTPAAETWAATLAAGRDSGGTSPYVNENDRLVIGNDFAGVPNPGTWVGQLRKYRFAGWYQEVLAGSGDEAGGTYLKSADLLSYAGGGAPSFGLALVVDWTLTRVLSTNGVDPLRMQGVAHARQRVLIRPTNSIIINPPVFSDIDQASGFDIARLVQGSANAHMAIEVLDTPAGSGNQNVEYYLHLDVIGQNDVAAF